MSIRRGGGVKHVNLLKKACHHVIESFDVTRMEIGFEIEKFRVEIRMASGLGSGYTSASFTFRPDMMIATYKTKDDALTFSMEKKWERITDSRWVVFEVETNPANIFNNNLKIEAYTQLLNREYSDPRVYAFVLVIPSAKKGWLEKHGFEPFDEVWVFDEDSSKPMILFGDGVMRRENL